MTRLAYLVTFIVIGFTGCMGHQTAGPIVPDNPFSFALTRPATAPPTLPKAAMEMAARVDQVGRKILEANANLGPMIQFHTIGAGQPEIFHVGATSVYLTDGLVHRCKDDGELAAVLCQELGKIVAEREVAAAANTRNPNRDPPPDVRVGPDYNGRLGSADEARLAELSRFEKRRSRPGVALPPPDPSVLARAYLKRAGFPEASADAVRPILQAASVNTTFEKQFTTTAK